MGDIKKAFDLAFSAFKERYGDDAKIEEGDQIVCVMNNCTLIISLNDGTLKQEFIGGKPLQIDYTLKIYESEETENE